MRDDELLERVKAHYGLDHRELPEFSRIDGYLVNEHGQIQLWVERKTRNVTLSAYPDVVVDAAKFFALIEMQDITMIPAVLAYGWSCGTWGILTPATVTKFTVETLTPREDSVSLNKGVARDVVKLDKSDFELYNNA